MRGGTHGGKPSPLAPARDEQVEGEGGEEMAIGSSGGVGVWTSGVRGETGRRDSNGGIMVAWWGGVELCRHVEVGGFGLGCCLWIVQLH